MVEAFQSNVLRQKLIEVAGQRKQLEATRENSKELWNALRKSEIDVAKIAIGLMRERLAEITVSNIEGKLLEHNVKKEIINSIIVIKTDTGVKVGAAADLENFKEIDPIIKSIIKDAGREARGDVLKEIVGVGLDLCIGRIYSELIGIAQVGTLQEFRGLFELKQDGRYFYLKSNFSKGPKGLKGNKEVRRVTDMVYSHILETYFKPILGLVLENSGNLKYTSMCTKPEGDFSL
ncbi:MAG: hypothetical protein KGH61_03810 [Candidatus Micrarchaeota archaeon]|nr:hypothetical protein [Candidatus Micrarchaeota archaeon]MDE1848047.1 hypothetical protein [Candidatus Micrarchaeota archaeon]MDE1864722.1 hypothetical protein [Candidatus Micrarchaeota archaeon]